MGALLHLKHGEGKRISLHYCVTDLISTGKPSLSLPLPPTSQIKAKRGNPRAVWSLLHCTCHYSSL